MDKYSEMLLNLRDIYNDKNKIREYALDILKIKEIEKLDYEGLNGIQIDYYLSLINTDDLRLKRIRGILLNRKWMLLNDKDKIKDIKDNLKKIGIKDSSTRIYNILKDLIINDRKFY